MTVEVEEPQVWSVLKGKTWVVIENSRINAAFDSEHQAQIWAAFRNGLRKSWGVNVAADPAVVEVVPDLMVVSLNITPKEPITEE